MNTVQVNHCIYVHHSIKHTNLTIFPMSNDYGSQSFTIFLITNPMSDPNIFQDLSKLLVDDMIYYKFGI